MSKKEMRCKRLVQQLCFLVEVLLSDNLALPYRDESFDAVLSIAVIHHIATTERRVRAIRELARILRFEHFYSKLGYSGLSTYNPS